MTSGAAAALACSKNTVKIDAPLTVLGSPPDSAGNIAKDSQTFEKMHKGIEIELAPIKSMRIFPCNSTDAMLRVRARMPHQLGALPWNPVNYFLACHLAIRELRKRGSDVDREQTMFDNALAAAGMGVADALATVLSEHGGAPQSAGLLKKGANKIRRVASILGYKPLQIDHAIDVKRKGIRDIADAAKYLGTYTVQL